MSKDKNTVLTWIGQSNSVLSNELRSMFTSDIRETLRTALIEQDRDTRHACAEAVLKAAEVWDKDEEVTRFATFDRCHAAVLNCKEGLK